MWQWEEYEGFGVEVFDVEVFDVEEFDVEEERCVLENFGGF